MRLYGAWIKRYCILCSKTYNTFHSRDNFHAGSRQAAGGARICETGQLCTAVLGWEELAQSYDRNLMLSSVEQFET